MENDPLDQALQQHLSDQAPPDVHTQAARHFAAPSPRVNEPIASTKFPRRPLLWFWAGVSLSGSVALAAFVVALFISPAPSWAQVAERFRNLKFFNATVFYSENVGQPPEKIDLWVAQDHRLRAHFRGLIFFGADGRINKVLSSDNGDEVPLEELKYRLRTSDNSGDASPALALVRGIARLGETPDFSLDRLLQLLSGKREELRPTPNIDTGTSSDMQVFDFSSDKSPEWMRLWILKKSELPVRLRAWNPCDGSQSELLFDYATQMPGEAFDPASVQAAVRGKNGTANRLYALLSDSGGQPITPEQFFATRGYHLPDIDSVGRTPEGVVWVLSRNVENHRPDGERVVGWSQLTDDLGQSYTHRVIGWLAADDTLLEYFVPDNLGDSFKSQKNYTLICNDSPFPLAPAPATQISTIGSIKVSNWKETASIPSLIQAQKNLIDGRTNWLLMAMDEAAEQQDWRKFDETAAAIPGNPETDLTALSRDVKRAHKYMLLQQHEDASRLCTRLYPLVAAGVKQGQPLYTNIVRWHIADLLRNGQQVEARILANKHATEALEHSKTEGPMFIIDLLVELRLAGLSESEATAFFDRNIVGLQAVRRQLEKSRLYQEPAQEPIHPLPPASS